MTESWIAFANAKIHELTQLERDWDSYRGVPTSEAAARSAILACGLLNALKAPKPSIVPLGCGGVQIEWHERGFDGLIVIWPDGQAEFEI